MTSSPSDPLQQAVAAYRAGDLAEAERLCRAIELARPADPGALQLLGVIAARQRRFEEARQRFEQVLAIDPRAAPTHLNLGNALAALGRREEALASYERAASIKPDYAEAHYAHANALLALGRVEESLGSFQRALTLRPDYPEALNNFGSAWSELRRFEEALICFDRALALKPDYLDALNNRGNALVSLGRFADALASYDRALAANPLHAELLNHRGNALRMMKRFDEALVCFDRALAVKPDLADAWNNRGVALQELGRYAESLASFDRALTMARRHAGTFSNRGGVLLAMGRVEHALASLQQALEIRPDHVEAINNRGMALLRLGRFEEAAADFARVLELAPEHDDTPGFLLHARLHGCDWRDYDRQRERIVADLRRGKRSAQPFTILGVLESPDDQRRCAALWAADKCPPAPAPLWRGRPKPHDRIRVAYLSADFREHAVAYLLAGLFERHDRERFEVTAISFGPPGHGPMRARLERGFEHFLDVRGKSDRAIAELVAERETDIAVDLMGFTADSRPAILAQRAAPIQVNYLGYPATLGTSFHDYIVADPFVIPASQAARYSERIAWLPDTYQGTDGARALPGPAPGRAELGLPEDGVVFCSFNSNHKFTPAMFAAWMRLLRAVDGSVLWLLAATAAVEANLRREAEARGAAPDRLVFAPRIDYAPYLARYGAADLFLDTAPFNAGTTASDALWAGLPVLTLAGEAFPARMAGSLLHAVGLPELVAASPAEYEALALRLGRDPAALASLRARLARSRATHALFDTDRFRRHLEAAYAAMWERFAGGGAPASFAVAPVPRS